MASAGHNIVNISLWNCKKILIFWKVRLFIVFFLNIWANPIISLIKFWWHHHFRTHMNYMINNERRLIFLNWWINTSSKLRHEILTFVTIHNRIQNHGLPHIILGDPGAASRDDRKYSKLLPRTCYRPKHSLVLTSCPWVSEDVHIGSIGSNTVLRSYLLSDACDKWTLYIYHERHIIGQPCTQGEQSWEIGHLCM